MNDLHFQRLLDLYFDGGLDAEDLQDFERLLLSDHQARTAFWEQAHLHEALRRQAIESLGAQTANRKERRPLMRLCRVGAAAALLVIMITVGFLISHRPTNDAPTSASTESTVSALPERPAPVAASVAVLSEVAGATWTAPQKFRKGAILEPGEMVLRSGMIGLTFFSGTRVVIEGPARLNILSESAMRINGGAVQIECPEVALGFTLLTPNGSITATDLGSVFGLATDDTGGIEVKVIEGVVAMRGNAEKADTELRENGIAAISESGRVSLRDRPEGDGLNIFVSNIHDREQQRFEKWCQTSQKRVGDESLLVYLRMLDDLDSTNYLLKNEGGSRAASSTGSIIAANWVAGRWPGKRALQFQSPEDRARISIEGHFHEVTFAAWVRIASFQRPFNVLFMSDRVDGDPLVEGEVHWQFSKTGGFRFSVRPSKPYAFQNQMGGRFHRAWNDDVLSPSDHGIWRHLVTSYSAHKKLVVHYLDGKELARHTLPEGLPLYFGRATIGNTSYASDQYWGPRQFGGAVDEFAIYSRVLGPHEIREFYKEGKPD